MKPNILVTGCCGFIGFHTVIELLRQGFNVHGIDSLNTYYDRGLKVARLNRLEDHNFTFHIGNLADIEDVRKLFYSVGKMYFDGVVHLAGQAGVRYSIDYPETYTLNNLLAFEQLIGACCNFGVPHLVYASSSSVYGLTDKTGFYSPTDNTDKPLSYYAATKKSNELTAHAYSMIHGLPTTGLRFFTAYGPWGRPDMALFLFTKNIIDGKPIDVYGQGNMSRDFTYVSDIVNGIIIALHNIPKEPRIFNVAKGESVTLTDFIEIIEEKLGKYATRNLLPMQPGDVRHTHADIYDIQRFGYTPLIGIEQGVSSFIDWYKGYYNV